MIPVLSRRSMLRGSAAFGVTYLLSAGNGTAAISEGQAVGRTDLTLRVQEVNGRPTYNGLSPGPTNVANPGDTIDVHLINDLPALHDDCTDNHNAFHGANSTNLHTHGLHVSPTTDSSDRFDADNVFVRVVPKDQVVPCAKGSGNSPKTFRWHRNKFRFETGADHPSGTFWYPRPQTRFDISTGCSGFVGTPGHPRPPWGDAKLHRTSQREDPDDHESGLGADRSGGRGIHRPHDHDAPGRSAAMESHQCPSDRQLLCLPSHKCDGAGDLPNRL